MKQPKQTQAELIKEWAMNAHKLPRIGIDNYVALLDEILATEDIALETRDDLVQISAKHNLDAMTVGMILIAAQYKGIIVEGIFPDYKTNLERGAKASVMFMHQVDKAKKQLKNGKTVEVQKWVGKVSKKDEDEPEVNGDPTGYVSALSEAGIKRNRLYLSNVVPGFIYGRLVQLADVDEGEIIKIEAKALVRKINRMVRELT